jgi:MFS family permease
MSSVSAIPIDSKIPEDSVGDLKDPAVDPYLVLMTPEVNPKNFPLLKKWSAIIIVSVGAACVTCASSMPSFIEPAIMQQFHVSQTAAILGTSLFVLGLGFGPLVVGPFSEVLGAFRLLCFPRAILTRIPRAEFNFSSLIHCILAN